jgi:hypothetical protein
MSRRLARQLSVMTNVALVVAAVVAVSENAAQAYLDAGTGSVLFQALMGALFASLLAVKVFWHRLTNFVSVSVLRRQPREGDGDSA